MLEDGDVLLFHSTNAVAQSKSVRAKISLKLLPNNQIAVDWSNLPVHRSVRQCVIHCKSLNDNRSEAIRLSRKKRQFVLEKTEPGYLYEIHVCTLDGWDGILASSERAQIQTATSPQAPTLRVVKSTPDFIWLQWEKPSGIPLLDIESYKLLINGKTKTILPSTENRFVVNDGQSGQRYIFQIEMIQRKGKKIMSSIPISIRWPGVTLPRRHVFINGNQEVLVCWGDSISISDGSIESYTLHLYDSGRRPLTQFGPHSTECRQILIKDLGLGLYFAVLEIKLANSNRSLYSKPMTIRCGQESTAPILSCHYPDSKTREQLIAMLYHFIKIRDRANSKRFLSKCEDQLHQILSILISLTDLVRLNLSIETKSNDLLANHRLIVNDQQCPTSIPWFIKEFPIELPRREKPYELAVAVTPDLYNTTSKKVFIESSGQFSFFCAHFSHEQPIKSCSYLETFLREKQNRRLMHQGFLKHPQPITNIQVYDLHENKVISLPLLGKALRFSALLLYINGCVPSITHLNYFATYASSHRTQCNFISINCNQNDIDDLKILTQDLTQIHCYTDFSSDDFRYEQNANGKFVHELFSIEGVPTYIILDYSGRIIWRGRLCVQNQNEYNAAMDHTLSEANQLPCPTDSCESCRYRGMSEAQIESDLDAVTKALRSIVGQRSSLSQSGSKQEQQQGEEHRPQTRQIVSMKNRTNELHDGIH